MSFHLSRVAGQAESIKCGMAFRRLFKAAIWSNALPRENVTPDFTIKKGSITPLKRIMGYTYGVDNTAACSLSLIWSRFIFSVNSDLLVFYLGIVIKRKQKNGAVMDG